MQTFLSQVLPFLVILGFPLFIMVKHRRGGKKIDKDMENLDRDESHEDRYPAAYCRMLEAYMLATRASFITYDKSNHSPRMAVIALENIRKQLSEIQSGLDTDRY